MKNTTNKLNNILRQMYSAENHEVILTEEYWTDMNCNRI